MQTFIHDDYYENKSHTEADFLFTIYPSFISKEYSEVPLHWHEEIELLHIHEVTVIVSIDLVSHQVFPGDIILIRPGQLHCIKQYKSHTLTHSAMVFHPDFLINSSIDICAREFFYPFLAGTCGIPSIITPNHPYHDGFSSPLKAVEVFEKDRSYGWQLGIKAQLFTFFYALFSSFEHHTALPSADPSYETLKKLLKHIELHYMESISIAQAAQIAGYSSSYLMKFFKERMGMSFTSYLNDYRLTIAARLLITTSLSILTIAEQTGFENLSHFNRQFKKKFAMTPRELRKAGNLA